MRAHCHVCARPTEAIPILDSYRACCGACGATYRDDAELSDGFAYHDEPKPKPYNGMTRPGVYLDVLRAGPSVAAPKCTRCGYASCPGSPCAVYDAPKPATNEQWASATTAQLDAEWVRAIAGDPWTVHPTRPPTLEDVHHAVLSTVDSMVPAWVAADVVVTEYTGYPGPRVRAEVVLRGSTEPAPYSDKSPPKPKAALFDEGEVERFIADQDALRRKIAYSLFRIEVQDEVMRICEMEPTRGGFLVHGDWDRVLRAMWTKTKLELRKRCEAKAADIVTLMAEPPEAL